MDGGCDKGAVVLNSGGHVVKRSRRSVAACSVSQDCDVTTAAATPGSVTATEVSLSTLQAFHARLQPRDFFYSHIDALVTSSKNMGLKGRGLLDTVE